MKSVNDIIIEMNQKQIPEDMKTIQEYSDSLYQVTGSITAVFSVLITKAREKYFTSSSEWLQWVKDTYKIQKSHAMHSLSVGRMLMQCETEIYSRLMGLSHDKLYTISSLTPDEIPEFVKTHNLDTMLRDEVRAAVNQTNGITEKSSVHPVKTESKFIDLARETAKMQISELQQVITEIQTLEDVVTILEAGKRLMAVGLDALQKYPINNVDFFNRLETYLKTQIEDVQAQKAKTLAQTSIAPKIIKTA